MNSFNTIENNISVEIEEKRSKFIANIFYVENINEAEKIIKQTKKKYYDAKHNCFAYIINDNVVIKKSSDDGEPSGTAGSPILNVLEKNNLCNILAIVTRYFGGILLGAGGLVRAYTQATTEAINKSKIVKQELGYELEVFANYQQIDKIKYYCNKFNLKITKINYSEYVKLTIELNEKEKEELLENCKNNIIKYNIIKRKYVKM